jgi:imidazoleglycerol-phosphate dehydratase
MDESLILTALDLSGRTTLCCELDLPASKVGNFDTELVEEFFAALCRSAEMTLHIRQLAGKNTHHIIEGTFKSFAHSLKVAVDIDEKNADQIPSTKGSL